MKDGGRLLLSACGALLLITAGGWIFGIETLWAFSFLIYIPLSFRLLLGGIVLLSAYPNNAVTKYASRRNGRTPQPLFGWVLRGLVVPLRRVREWGGFGWKEHTDPQHPGLPFLWLFLAGLLFWFWREQSYYGDALLKLQLLTSQTLASDPYIWKEPLDSFSAYTFTALFRAWHWSPATAIAQLSILAGLLYMAAVFGVCRLLAATRQQQISYGAALLALGSSQLWFGHIENYSLVTATTFGSIVLAVGYLQRQVRLGWVGLVAGMAVSFHPQALFAMPALLLLLEWRQGWRQILILGSSTLIAPLLTGLCLWWAGAPFPTFGNGYAGDQQLFWTLGEALSPRRLADALNNLWLVAPLFPLWLAAGLSAGSQARTRRDPIWRYLSGVTLGLLFYHFAFQNDLPRWRDWDLFAIVGPGVTLWGIYSWWALAASNGSTGSETQTATWRLLLRPALIFAVAFTFAWVGTNHYRTLLQPNTDQQALYLPYRLLDLQAALAAATITPDTPICGEATGCERVAATTFLMPQDGDVRPVIFAHAPVQIAWALDLPAEATFLWLSPALDPIAWGWGGDGVTFSVVIRQGGEEELLWSRHLTPTTAPDLDWQEIFIDLARYAGQSVTLVLVTAPGIADNNAGDRAGWGLPWLMRGTIDRRFIQQVTK